MAGSWKTALLLALTIGSTVWAQGNISPSSVSPNAATTSSPSLPPVNAIGPGAPNQRPEQDGIPRTNGAVTGAPGVSLPPSAAQGMRPPPGPPAAPGAGSPPGAGGPPGEAAGGAAPPSMPPGMEKPKSPFIYIPSFSMAVAGSVAYLIISYVTLMQVFRYKSWYFFLVPQAALMDAVGTIARTHATLHLSMKPGTEFIMQMMLLSAIPSLVGIINIMSFTRVIWWMTPDEKRTKQVLKVAPNVMSLFWAGFAVIPDMAKAPASILGKPKGHDERPNPTSIWERITSVCLVVQFFAFFCWTLWAVRYMLISRRWMMSGDVIEKRGRRLGWACVVAGVFVCIRVAYSTIERDAMYNPMAFVSQHEWIYWVGSHLPVFAMYIIFIIHQPGKYLPRDYMRFKFDPKKIEKLRREDACLRRETSATTITPVSSTSKGFETRTLEIHPGSRV